MRKKILSNMVWRFLERVGAQLVGFVVSIILARLLSPAVYGQIALVNVFIAIMQVFVDSGLGNALIQKEEIDDLDYSSVFSFNLLICGLIYFILFLIAPFISNFLGDVGLTPVLRVVGLTIIISGIKNIQQAYVSKNMLFKRFFFSTSIGTVAAAAVGIYMAISGYGIWALVIQGLVNNIVDTCVLWITVGWSPKIAFSWERFEKLFSYGWKLSASSLLDTLYDKIKSLMIGKMYTPADLAYFDRGDTFPNLFITNINSSINSVLFPAMSEIQSDRDRMKEVTCRSIKISTYILAPLMIGLAVCAKPLVIILLTEKWLQSVFFIQVFCFVYLFYPIHTANLNAIKAMGRSDIFLKLEIIKKILGMTILIISMLISVKAMAIGVLITSIISQIINAYPNKELLGYSYKEQMIDIMSNLLLGVGMGLGISWLPIIISNYLMLLITQVVIGAIIYILLSVLFKNDSYLYLTQMIKETCRKKVGMNK